MAKKGRLALPIDLLAAAVAREITMPENKWDLVIRSASIYDGSGAAPIEGDDPNGEIANFDKGQPSKGGGL